jgi:hypothetical protein
MVPVERPKTNEKFASREKILKWKTGLRAAQVPFVWGGGGREETTTNPKEEKETHPHNAKP